jgi:Uma2 family endonuclease
MDYNTLMSQVATPTISFEDFLKQAPETSLTEWVSGNMVVMNPPSEHHQDVSDFLTSILRFYIEAHKLGKLRSAPFLMKLASSAREPDLLFISKDNPQRLKPNFLDGPADLVIEIISPESRARDRGEKFYEYEQAGISEYWLLDPVRKQAEFYQLKDGIYQLVQIKDGRYHSQVLTHLWLEVSWLWQDPLPTILEVLKSWKLIQLVLSFTRSQSSCIVCSKMYLWQGFKPILPQTAFL